MKIKTDHVSNSSSASFILQIDSSTNNFSEFVESWERYIKCYIQNHSWRVDERVKKYLKQIEENKKEREELLEKKEKGTITESEKNYYNLFYADTVDKKITKEEAQKIIIGQYMISQAVGNVFEVTYWTSMYNTVVEDLPEWMTYLIIHFNMDPNTFKSFGFKGVHLKIEDD